VAGKKVAWQEAIDRWRRLSPEKQREIRRARIPRDVARSMAFEGELVDEEQLRRRLETRHQEKGKQDVSTTEDFASLFEHLTGNPPFPWQHGRRDEPSLLDELLAKRFPAACDIPTGLGKTSVIALWLLALAHHARAGTVHGFPRRLVYVVNRRTVVDQATREAERLRKALASDAALAGVAEALHSLAAVRTEAPVAISTLRGQHADNAEWRSDPARPAIIIGTVDMIGSRLLF